MEGAQIQPPRTLTRILLRLQTEFCLICDQAGRGMNNRMHKKEKKNNNKTTAHLSAFFFLGDLFCFNKSDTSQGERKALQAQKESRAH